MNLIGLVLCCKCRSDNGVDVERRNNDGCITEKLEKGPFVGCRHIQMFLYFLLMMYSYCMRSVLSVAIVAMNDNSTSANHDVPVYHWTDRSIVLSTFFCGYIICQFPAAHFGKKYGIKWILVCTNILDSTSCILIPTMANEFGSKGVMVCRFLQGLAQGFLLPSIHTLLGHWAPPNERSRIGTFAYAGSVFGNIFSMPITGLICSSWLGWPFSFYLWGAFGLSWSFIWMVFGFDKPKSHNNITKIEKDYIEKSLGHCKEKDNEAIPWMDILSSPPVWALIVSNLGVNWGSSILLTQTPTYLNKILKFDIKANAALSAAPYLAMWLFSFIFSTTCDFIINRNWISRGCARKIFNSIGTLCPALGLLYLGFTPKDQAYLSVGILILVGGTIGAGFCGFQVNHIDLSPNHSGILMALSNGCTSIFSVISPLVVQYVVTDQANQDQWKIIFIVSALVYATTDVFFICFASGEVQKWNESCESSETIKDKYIPKTDI
ncbi:putative inorganic phosphate cotransporter [Anthonomus grandis grandis]|uniref:putative inorganic phosphate cotransporter n=1 Tax=Anthonomus grandis grandis TaxID=2921223 RepID=UPI0021653CDE|nr:putative inorganic phosphate cotransporter [Anthonomus grandis grandis]